MIRLGLRLTLAGGREAITRLALITVAVAVGVGLLLTTLASLNAVNAQNARYAWLETAPTQSHPADTTAAAPPARDPVWWRLRGDYFQGKVIGRLDVAVTGPDSPVPPGIKALPGPGQFYASPALATLLRDTPAAELGDRYPGTQIGTIGAAALPAPNSLIIIVGRSVAELAHQADVIEVARISTTTPSNCGDYCVPGVGIDNNGITLILSVVAAALLFPVLIFIGGATRLSAARREQRFAAMRLVGATPRQISIISTVESAVAAIAGVVLGFGLFYAFRPALAAIPFTGDPFFTTDLSLTLTTVLIVTLGIPIAAAVAAWIALRRVTVSPLGVTRRVTPKPPRARRLIPLLAGVVELGYVAYFSDIGDSRKHPGQTQAYFYLAGILLIMTGLVVAGPWLTMLGSRLMARCANRPATLIAARRLADNPRAGFRAISGLVLALFIGTCTIAILTAILAQGGSGGSTAGASGTVVDELGGPHPVRPTLAGSEELLHRLASIPGVTGTTLIRTRPDGDGPGQLKRYPPDDLVSCAQLVHTPALGHCPDGAQTVSIIPDFGGGIINKSVLSETTWPAADRSVEQLRGLPLDTIAVGTDGSTAAVEQTRTVLEATFDRLLYPPQTLAEIRSSDSRLVDGYQRLADVIMLTSLPIAGCSLAVSVAGGLAERKRPFSLLRLTGAPLGMLRRVITIEAAAPLLAGAVASIAAGLLAAHLFLHAQLKQPLHAPGLQYYVVVLAGLAASLAIIASTLPLLRRMTGPETARNE